MTRHLIGLALAASVAVPAFADIVHLKHGGTIEGQVTQTDDAVIVKLPEGEVRLPKNVVARIEKRASKLDEYQKRAKAIRGDDAAAHYRLALWAQSVGLKTQAREHFRRVVAISPDHAQARQALGYRLFGGQWMTEREEMKARGLVQHEGQWMSPQAAERLRALQAELELAREKRRAAEAELKKTQQQLKRTPDAAQPFPGPYHYGRYYSTLHLGGGRTYYWRPPYDIPYYTGSSFYHSHPYHQSPYGLWWFYPGGRRYVPPSKRRHHARPHPR